MPPLAPTVLGELFPAGVAAVVMTLGDEPPCSFAAEREAIAGARPGRRREFLAGRACAHAALGAIGRDGRPIARAATREPLWPAGVVGSIAHAGDLAGAVVAHAAQAWGLGLDIEVLDPPLDAAVERLVLRPGELAGRRDLAKLAFAVKECVYKALYPRTCWRLDFHDVHVEIDPAAGCYRAVVDPRFRLAGRPLAALDGRFATVGGHVFAGLFMGSAGPDRGTGRSPRGRRRPRACS